MKQNLTKLKDSTAMNITGQNVSEDKDNLNTINCLNWYVWNTIPNNLQNACSFQVQIICAPIDTISWAITQVSINLKWLNSQTHTHTHTHSSLYILSGFIPICSELLLIVGPWQRGSCRSVRIWIIYYGKPRIDGKYKNFG